MDYTAMNKETKKFISVFAGLLAIFFPVFSQNAVRSPDVKSPEAKAVIESRLSGKNVKSDSKDKNPVVYNENFEKGEELFSLNEPEKAIPYFEKALESENVNPAVYVYLGVAYYQTGDYNKSLSICVQGLAQENTDRKVLAYNAGNSCYAMGNYMRADASYAIAIREDSSYAPAVLNRANAQLKMDHLEDAKNNYIKYLELAPESPQREKIEEVIRLLAQEIDLRAKQKPELINPDEFVENEKMESADEIEKVDEIIPVYAAEKNEEPEKVDSVAPALPVVKKEQDSGEKISGNLAVLPPEKQNEKIEDAAEKVQDNLVSFVNQVDEKFDEEKADDEKAEKVKDHPPLLPAAAENEKINEKPDEKLVSDLEIPESVKDEKEPAVSEKVNPSTLATDDYQKNEEERKRIAREKAEKQAALEKEKAEKAAAIEREKQLQAEKERAEMERKAAQERAEQERQDAEDSMIKMDADDPYLNPAAVPDKVEVKENDDGTVGIKIPTLSFKINSSELTDSKSNIETVQEVYDILSDKKYSDLNVTITGYVNPDNDEWTKDEENLALARAESVKQRLVKMGVSAERISARHGSGKSGSKEYNRRVEFLLSK